MIENPFTRQLYIICTSRILHVWHETMIYHHGNDAPLSEKPPDIRIDLLSPQFISGEESSSMNIHHDWSVGFISMRHKDIQKVSVRRPISLIADDRYILWWLGIQRVV